MVSTKVYKGFQTVIPAKMRKELNIQESDILEWEKQDNKLIITPKPKRDLKELVGLIKTEKPTNAVEITKKLRTGEF